MKVKVTFISMVGMSNLLEDLNTDRCPVVEVEPPSRRGAAVPQPARSPAAGPRAADHVSDSLDSLPLGQPATVIALGGQRSFRRRLLELGFVPGTPVTLRNVAPLGDPLEIEIRGCRVSIRRAEAGQIQVERLGEGA